MSRNWKRLFANPRLAILRELGIQRLTYRALFVGVVLAQIRRHDINVAEVGLADASYEQGFERVKAELGAIGVALDNLGAASDIACGIDIFPSVHSREIVSAAHQMVCAARLMGLVFSIRGYDTDREPMRRNRDLSVRYVRALIEELTRACVLIEMGLSMT